MGTQRAVSSIGFPSPAKVFYTQSLALLTILTTQFGENDQAVNLKLTLREHYTTFKYVCKNSDA